MDWSSDSLSQEDENITEFSGLPNFLDDPDWASSTLAALEAEFSNPSEPNTQDLLPCGQNIIDSLRVRQLHPEDIRPQLPRARHWRRVHTDVTLVDTLDTLSQRTTNPTVVEIETSGNTKGSGIWESLVHALDLTIILSGAPGEGRLELVQSCIAYIQHNRLPPYPPDPQSTLLDLSVQYPSGSPLRCCLVPEIEPPPAFSAFSTLARQPFVMPNFAKDWPAKEKWRSKSYLLSCSGRGRVVPVERGGDYRNDDWGVDVMSWDLFLDTIGWEHPLGDEGDPESLYLAQHSLFTQFPKLRADIFVPDYVYAAPDTQCSAYLGPPGNDEQLVINAWCGGRGANSPAHTDPYYNIYVQVVGHKSIWLAPPDATPGMYAFEKSPTDDSVPAADGNSKRDGMLGNTASIDVFALSAPGEEVEKHPLFYKHALPLSQSTILKPGDALVIPPGWWHAMRGIGGGSFSVSFWF